MRSKQRPSGPRRVAFFGVLYYSGLRPEEAIGLRRRDVALPDAVWDDDAQEWHESEDAWGELYLRAARPDAGKHWTNDGSARDQRGLKHRAEGETRRVPCPPPLTKFPREHMANFKGDPADRCFGAPTVVRFPRSPTGVPGTALDKAIATDAVASPAFGRIRRHGASGETSRR